MLLDGAPSSEVMIGGGRLLRRGGLLRGSSFSAMVRSKIEWVDDEILIWVDYVLIPMYIQRYIGLFWHISKLILPGMSVQLLHYYSSLLQWDTTQSLLSPSPPMKVDRKWQRWNDLRKWVQGYTTIISLLWWWVRQEYTTIIMSTTVMKDKGSHDGKDKWAAIHIHRIRR